MQSISYEHLLDLKFGNESEITQTFIKSEMPSLKKNYDALMTFLGNFYFISYQGSAAKNMLKIPTLQIFIIQT